LVKGANEAYHEDHLLGCVISYMYCNRATRLFLRLRAVMRTFTKANWPSSYVYHQRESSEY